MSRPWKSPDTGFYYLRKHVPADIRALLGLGQLIKRSLGTKDPAEARKRFSVAHEQLIHEWAFARCAPKDMTREQLVALVGRWYRWFVDWQSDELGSDPEGWVMVLEKLADIDAWGLDERDIPDDAPRPAGVAQRVAAYLTETARVSEFLAREGVKLSPASMALFLDILEPEFRAAHLRLRQLASNDFSPDLRLQRFPQPTPSVANAAATTGPQRGGKKTLTELLEGWWGEAQRTGKSPKTYEAYKSAVTKLCDFLGHVDASAVTPGDVVSFKEHRLQQRNARTGELISPKTVKDSDLAGLKTVLGWGRSNHYLAMNAAEGITIKLGKEKRTRPKHFTEDEAKRILSAALHAPRGGDHAKTHAAKKWVPWLCAYTGARVGEMAQLRREDIEQRGATWVVTIDPVAGTVKTGERREVPLHEHVVELGFIEFWESSGEGHLFIKPSKKGAVRGPLKGLTNRLADFVRKDVGITDTGVKPTHGWRHRFKSMARELGIPDSVADDIQGHAKTTAGSRYGESTIKAKANAIAIIPWIELQQPTSAHQ